MNKPLVSIVMPVYNHENFVEQALDSIFTQTYSNLEIIIIDDGSKDTSPQKIEKFLEKNKNSKHNVIFIKQENKGAHVTINYGLSLAKGEWLTILNSDDFYHPTRIEKCLNECAKYEAKLAFSYVNGIDKNSVSISSCHWWYKWYEGTKFKLYERQTPTIGFQLLQDNLAVSTGNLFFSKELFKEIGPFKNLKLAHDLDFIIRSLIITEPLLIKESLYFYRLHDSNTQYQVKHLIGEEFKQIYRDYLIAVTEKPPKNKMAPSYWYWPLNFGAMRLQLKMDKGLDSYILNPIIMEKIQLPQITFLKKKKVKKISLITHELSLTGAPKLILDISICLKKNGYEPNIIAFKDGPLKEVIKRNGISLFVPPFSRSNFSNVLWQVYSFLFKTQKYCIVNSIKGWTFIFLRSIFTPWRKTIWYIHESFPLMGMLGPALRRIVNPFYKYVHKWFPPKMWFGSKGTQLAWENSGFEKGEVIYWSGIERKPLVAVNPKKKIRHLLVVGTASARKGTHLLIDAFISCIQKNKIDQDVILTIVGFTDSSSSTFLSLGDSILKVIHTGLLHRIKMVKSLDPYYLDEYYKNADLFIQPSVQECLPIALLTAMSYGMPIITTNIPGCVEAIKEGHSGYVCNTFDIDSLGRSIVEAVNNPEKSWNFGKNAQIDFNEKFSIEATQEKILVNLSKNFSNKSCKP